LFNTVATIRIPCSNDRRQATYAQLIRRVNMRGSIPFEGRLLRTGAAIEEADLRPTPEWPETPLLIEYAGNDRSGHGHRRSNDLHILWRFDAGEWIEIARISSQGPEWHYHLVPIVRREICSAPVNFVEVAGKITELVLALLDHELDGLEDEGRARTMSFLYDKFTARFVRSVAA
jgi:hypothetical protein